MEKQNGTGKTAIQLRSLPKSRRQRFFLICGTCNVVSIAENTSIEGKTGEQNSTGLKEEKCSIAMRKAQNNGDKCTPDNADKSWVDVSDDPIKSSANQDLDKFQSLTKGMADDYGGKMGRCASTKKKVCWSDRDEDDNLTDEVDGQSSADRLPGQGRSNVPQNNFEQNSLPSRKTSLQLKGADECKNSEEALKQRVNLTAKRVAWSGDPSQSQEQLLDENAPPSPLPPSDNKLPGKNASNTPEIEINDAAVKPAWSGNEAEVTSTPAYRWKLLAPIKFKMNRIQGKRMVRDTATVREEYEMMMENLKLYGVL